MKSRILFLAIYLVSNLSYGQTMRYFEVHRRGQLPTDAWRDSVYVVAADWTGTPGYFCGWSYVISREINISVRATEPMDPTAEFLPIAPNPVNDEVTFWWTQPSDATVLLNVTEMSGQLSITLPLGQKEAGRQGKTMTASALSAGIYVATLRVGEQTMVQRFVVAH
jgi:Secretion system C-terminal sorting domain